MEESLVRVIYLTEIAGLGGGETSLLNLMQSIVDGNGKPLLLCPEGALYQRALHLNLPVVPIRLPPVRLYGGWFPMFSFPTISKIYHVIKNYNADILHAESFLGLFYGGIAAKIAGIPCVVTYHGYWQLKHLLSRMFVSKFCDRIYPVSDSVLQEIRESIDPLPGKIFTIPLGFHKSFLEELPERLAARRALGLPLDRPIVMQVARFQPIKGQMNLLLALEALHQPPYEGFPLVVFVGDVLEPASMEDIRYMQEVKAKANSYELRAHVQFMGSRNDVPLLMRAADVIVNPSDFETFSMTTIEAMAVGTPVIATNVGGPKEIIENMITGILVPPKNPTALAEAIYQVIANPVWAEKLALNAKCIAFERYAPQVRYKQLMKEYAVLTGRSAPMGY